MRQFQSLMAEDPEKGKAVLSQGQDLTKLAQNGNYFKFSLYLSGMITDETVNNSFPFMYFLQKSLEISLFNLHFMISSFIIDNGYPLNDHRLPNLLINSLKNMELNDEHCCEIIRFLKMKSFDFNRQVIPLSHFLLRNMNHASLFFYYVRKKKLTLLLCITLLKDGFYGLLKP
jgi:hypothetical protein